MNTYYFSNQSSDDFLPLLYYLGHMTIKRFDDKVSDDKDSGTHKEELSTCNVAIKSLEPPAKRQCLEIYDISKDKIEWVWGLFNQEDTFVYQDYKFVFEMIQREEVPKLHTFSGNIVCLKTIILKTQAPLKTINQFLMDAKEHFDTAFAKKEKPALTYSLYDARNQCWRKIGDVESREIDSIYIPDEDIKALLKIMDDHRDKDKIKRLNELNIPHKKIYLFEGVWGSCKTSTIRMLATKYQVPLYVIPFSGNLNDEKLTKAIDSVPSKAFIVLEDIDTLFMERKKGDEHKNDLTFSGLLNALDGIYYKRGREIFLTTNYKTCLDPALIRPGRVDFVLTFKYAMKEQILKMYQRFTKATDEQCNLFWEKYRTVRCSKLTMATLQQYLREHIDSPQEAIDKMNELKTLIDATTPKDNSSHLYS
jgi:mitochondrial chaperone BCS1